MSVEIVLVENDRPLHIPTYLANLHCKIHCKTRTKNGPVFGGIFKINGEKPGGDNRKADNKTGLFIPV